jgi:hypothetical protein
MASRSLSLRIIGTDGGGHEDLLGGPPRNPGPRCGAAFAARLRAVNPLSAGRRASIAALFALGVGLLAAGVLGAGFLNDDFVFLEQARTQSLLHSLTRGDALGNYYRPLSRQIYFAALTPLAHGSPHVFHAVNFAIFLGILALLADLLLVLVPPLPALAGLLYFATLPLQRVGWLWISCSQDLLALLFGLAGVAAYRRSRRWLALAFMLAALASKESALALPVLFVASDVWLTRRPPRASLVRALPHFALAALWGVIAVAVNRRAAGAQWLHFDAGSFLAALAHEAQSLLGIDHPPGFIASMLAHGPNPLALLVLAAIALLLPAPRPADASAAPTPGRGVIAFAGLWCVACGLVTGPVVANWNAYYYMMAAAGAALLVAIAARRMSRASWPLFAALLLWWHAGGSATRAFATDERPWGWTSHITSFYLERAAALTDSLSRQLRRLEPAPLPETRFFFATLPPYAGFQMGSGALVRELYRDPSLQSWFYSQYGESTAADHPLRFLYWNGRTLGPLYPGLENPMFQVGADLLLLDRFAGASHAFRRGLASGGDRMDLLYWLGWAELWQGHREAAEAAWLGVGARDDSVRWAGEFEAARGAYHSGDSLAERRHLAAAIQAGMGRPGPHAALGELLMNEQPKYALLELSVAVWLDPAALRPRRLLVRGLAQARLEATALRQLEALELRYVGWRSERELVDLDRELRAGAAPRAVVDENRSGGR